MANGNATDLGGCPLCPILTDRGGGIYGVTATLILSDSALFGNVASTAQLTTAAGGGGVYLAFGRLTVNRSVFQQNNGASRGGGVLAGFGIVSINDSRFADNVAGEGGGLSIGTAQANLARNTVERNIAQSYGGGLSLDDSQVTMTRNIIRANQTMSISLSSGGGGLSVITGQYVIVNNTISDNTSNSLGGGISAVGCVCKPTVMQIRGNRITGNTAVIAGGGILAGVSGGVMSGNIITGNRAGLAPGTMGAGGIAISDGGQYQLINNLIADNAVGATAEGSALAIAGGQALLLHNTIARNSGGTIGIGVIVTGGVFSPLTSTATLVNNIVFSHAVGMLAVANNQITANGTLLFANGVDMLPGPINITNTVTGDPKFDLDGYHVLIGSAAFARGVPGGVTIDIDGRPRSMIAPTIGTVELGTANNVYLPFLVRELVETNKR